MTRDDGSFTAKGSFTWHPWLAFFPPSFYRPAMKFFSFPSRLLLPALPACSGHPTDYGIETASLSTPGDIQHPSKDPNTSRRSSLPLPAVSFCALPLQTRLTCGMGGVYRDGHAIPAQGFSLRAQMGGIGDGGGGRAGASHRRPCREMQEHKMLHVSDLKQAVHLITSQSPKHRACFLQPAQASRCHTFAGRVVYRVVFRLGWP